MYFFLEFQQKSELSDTIYKVPTDSMEDSQQSVWMDAYSAYTDNEMSRLTVLLPRRSGSTPTEILYCSWKNKRAFLRPKAYEKA